MVFNELVLVLLAVVTSFPNGSRGQFADVCGANTSTMADFSSHHNVTHGKLGRKAQNHSQVGVSGSSQPPPPLNENGYLIFLNNFLLRLGFLHLSLQALVCNSPGPVPGEV